MDVMEEKDVYLADFTRVERERGPAAYPALGRLRQDAVNRFADLGFPAADDEEWRFTNLAPLLKIPFALVDRDVPIPESPYRPAFALTSATVLASRMRMNVRVVSTDNGSAE